MNRVLSANLTPNRLKAELQTRAPFRLLPSAIFLPPPAAVYAAPVLKGVWRRLDDWVIRAACGSVRSAKGVASRAEEALQRLSRPDCFHPAVEVPELRFRSERDFEFDSPLPSPWDRNNRVRGRIYRAGERWQERPAALLVHGWNGELGYDYQFPYLSRHLRRQGINAVMLELPYHGTRRPRGPMEESNFLSPDFLSMVEAVRQALAEMGAMIRWLETQGVRRVGVWGVSLGGWLSGLLVSHHPGLHAAVLVTPVVQMNRAVDQLPFFHPVRENLRGETFDLGVLNLDVRKPLLPPEQILLVAAHHDRFVPFASVEGLRNAWGNPPFWTRPHGHISILLSLTTMKATTRWLAERLGQREKAEGGR